MPSNDCNQNLAVLVVDGDPRFLAWCGKQVGECGARLIGGDSIESAERLISAQEVNVLVASRDLSGNRNLEFVHRATAAFPGLFAVVVTDSTTARSPGQTDLSVATELCKPFTAGAFCNAVNEAIRLGTLARKLLANQSSLESWLIRAAAIRAASVNDSSCGGPDGELPEMQMISRAMNELSSLAKVRRPVVVNRPAQALPVMPPPLQANCVLRDAITLLSRCRDKPATGKHLRQRIDELLNAATPAA